MESEQLRSLAAILHQSSSADNLRLVESRLAQMGMTLKDLFQELSMTENTIEVFYFHRTGIRSTPEHSHTFLEVIYCLSSGIQLWVGDTEFLLNQGDLMLIPPEIPHRVEIRQSALDFQGYCLWIRMDFITTLQSWFSFMRRDAQLKELHIPTAGSRWEFLSRYFKTAWEEWTRKSPGYESALIATVLALLTDLTRALEDNLQPPTDAPLLKQLLEYVHANLSESLTSESVARDFKISTSTLGHLFTREMGISFHKYVNRCRLQEARKLIAMQIPMERVSAQVGFGDYSAFYRAFKREYGISPKEFRVKTNDADFS